MNTTLVDSRRPHLLSDKVTRGSSFEILSLTPWPRISRYRGATERSTVEHRQGAYFAEMLSQQLRRIDYRIGKCRSGIAAAERVGDVDTVQGFRRLMQAEQQERNTVEGLLENLQRRFRLAAARGIP